MFKKLGYNPNTKSVEVRIKRWNGYSDYFFYSGRYKVPSFIKELRKENKTFSVQYRYRGGKESKVYWHRRKKKRDL